MERKAFGKLADGEEATLYTISNTKGMYAQITDFGASIVSLVVKAVSYTHLTLPTNSRV